MWWDPLFAESLNFQFIPTSCLFRFPRRKSSGDDEVVALAKSLIKTWKKFVPESSDKKDAKKKEDKPGANGSGGDSSSSSSKDSKGAKDPSKSFPPK